MYAQNIKIWRARRGLSQTDLANKIGIHRTTMNRIEKERLAPSVALLERIAQVLNVPVAELFDESLVRR